MVKVTLFKNIYDKTPYYLTLDRVLERIKHGASKVRVEEIRETLDKEKSKSLKKMLPSVRFSGEFESWTDTSLKNHSGYLVMDFDGVYDIGEKMAEVTSHDFVYAAWVSPSGNGIKALARIADGKQHRAHFEALKEIFPDIDKSGINESRICFESYDPHLYINEDAVPFKKTKVVEFTERKEVVNDSRQVFHNLLKWITNRGDAFVTGERNIFLFKLAAACCRFGMDQDVATQLMITEFKSPNSDCSIKGFTEPIRNAYKANRHRQGSAKFERDILVDISSRQEIDVQQEFKEAVEEDGKLEDVIYGIDMKQDALDLFRNGYESIHGIGIEELDKYWKPWRKEITLLTGYGNYGKSNFMKWYMVMRAVLFGEKMALFAPEDKENIFYHELTEILLGQDCTPNNKGRTVTEAEYSNAYDFISAHFFYVYPKTLAPTPQYIKEKFLELIIKEGVSWCIIDPFNQMTNDYQKHGGRSDKYLETILSDFKRFAKLNNIFFMIIAHPIKTQKAADGNYPCPDVFDIADGAMWSNKMDNILVYHRPLAQTEPMNAMCTFYSKKIKDQKVVGIKGWFDFELNRAKRRYTITGRDHLGFVINEKQLSWRNPVPVQGRLIEA